MLRGLVKIAELDGLEETPEERAIRRIRKYRSITENKPDVGQVARYAGIGAGLGLGGSYLENVIKGKPTGDRVGQVAGKRGATARAIAGRVVGAALTTGLAPIARHITDQHAAKKDLQRSLDELQAHRQAKVAEAIEHLAKYAFTTSEFSGPLSCGSIPQVSGMPDSGSAAALLRTTNAKVRDRDMPKTAAPTTISGWARKAKAVGNPRVTDMPGRSIADQIKPEGPGFGAPLPGAKKGGVV